MENRLPNPLRQLIGLALKEKAITLLSSSMAIMLVAFILITWELQAASAYQKLFTQTFDITQAQSIIFYLAYTYAFFALLPGFFSVFFLKETLQTLAVRWPSHQLKAWLLTLFSFPICFACLMWLSKTPSFQSYYGFSHHVSFEKFITIQLTLLPIYYVAEEFFFRGFILLNLYKRLGWHAIWITEFLFVIAHVAKPGLEIIFAIPVGIVLNLLTLWTRSIAPAIAYHYCIGLLVNFLVYWN